MFVIGTAILLAGVFVAGLLVGRKHPGIATAVNVVTSPIGKAAEEVVAKVEAKA